MKFDKQSIAELQAIFKDELGIVLSQDEAVEIGNNLTTVMEVIFKTESDRDDDNELPYDQ